MTDDTDGPSTAGLSRGRRDATTTGDAAGMSGIRVALLLLLVFLNLLVLWVLWSLLFAT